MAARQTSSPERHQAMIEQNPDLIQRRIDDRQATIRTLAAQARHQQPHPLRRAIGMAIIRTGERIRGDLAERPREPLAPTPRARYAR